MTRMPFGKWRGYALEEINEEYLDWLTTIDLRPWLRREVEAELERRRGQEERQAPQRETRGVDKGVALEIVTRGYRVLSLETHPDRGGDLERMKAVNGAARWLRESIGRMLPGAS